MVTEFDKQFEQENEEKSKPPAAASSEPADKKPSKPEPEPESPKPKKKVKKNSPPAELSSREDKKKETKAEGSYEDNDSAKEIINIRKDTEKKMLEFYVTWKPRKNSHKTPQPTWISDNILKIHNPDVLCDFLLQKIKWPKTTE